jgi:general secretion pathway protein K
LVKGRDGFVLIAVIFITGLLAVTTTAFVSSARNNALFARALLYNQQLEAVADGMARLIAMQFSTRDTSKPFPMQFSCRWDNDISIHYEIQDQAGLVDLNTANPALITSLLRGLGLAEQETTMIAAAIADYKDPDTQTQDGQDEAALYKNSGKGPSNGPFAVVEELDRITVISDDLYNHLLPLVTVHSQQPGFDPAQAPRDLLDAVGKGTTFASPSPARVYSIVVKATREKGGTYTRSLIIALTGQPDRPFALLKWGVSRLQEKEAAIPSLTNYCGANININ